jgi:hypothetical protein
MNILYKISDDYFLLKEQVNDWSGDYICIAKKDNGNIFLTIKIEFKELSYHIKKNTLSLDTLYYYFYANTFGSGDFLIDYYHFVKYCIEELNFSEDNFKQDLSNYIVKILQNLIFQ